MKQSAYRSVNTPAPAGGNMAPIDDHDLCLRVLQLPLGDSARAQVQALAERLTPGVFGQMSKSTRDKMWKFAMENGAIPKPKKRKQTGGLHAYADQYDSRESEGTEVAAAIIASQVPKYGGQMPVPPPMRRGGQ